ncbi:MAG: hypothetical protein M1503_10335 [Thaumarchaeota archaeon]|nr:hypothetical protein [Nitrososphaerota archaeon]MCL5318638.1 hypothetical protein [Nitrososphaerota archaeon]
MAERKKIRNALFAQAIGIFALANLIHIVFWYFILGYAPSVLSTIAEISQSGRTTHGTVELLNLSDQLSIVVMRWGLIPVYVGAVGDLTPYYIGYAAVVAISLAIWIRRRMNK